MPWNGRDFAAAAENAARAAVALARDQPLEPGGLVRAERPRDDVVPGPPLLKRVARARNQVWSLLLDQVATEPADVRVHEARALDHRPRRG